jgi:5-methylcytosine-specific restriction enzyme A
MPLAPPRTCLTPGCPELVTPRSPCVRGHGGVGRARQRERRRRFDATRPSARQRGYDAAWRAAREEYLAANPSCLHCEVDGYTSAATVVDHVVPHRGDALLFADPFNRQPLCARCHAAKSARENGLAPCRGHERAPRRDVQGSTVCCLCGRA